MAHLKVVRGEYCDHCEAGVNIVTIARQGWILRGRSPLEVVPGGPAGEVVCLAPHPRVLPGRGPRPVLGLRGLQLRGVAHEVVAGAGHDPEHGCINDKDS